MTFLKFLGIMVLIVIALVVLFILLAVATKIICWVYEKMFL